MHVAAESRRNAAGDDPKGAAESVTCLGHLIDCGHHALRRVRVRAADRRSLDVLDVEDVRIDALEPDVDRADGLREAQDIDPEVTQQLLRHSPAATRVAVSRADDRSSTLPMSVWPYFKAPARSA